MFVLGGVCFVWIPLQIYQTQGKGIVGLDSGNLQKIVLLKVISHRMYGIFAYIYHENPPNVGKYTIHGSYGCYLFCETKDIF